MPIPIYPNKHLWYLQQKSKTQKPKLFCSLLWINTFIKIIVFNATETMSILHLRWALHWWKKLKLVSIIASYIVNISWQEKVVYSLEMRQILVQSSWKLSASYRITNFEIYIFSKWMNINIWGYNPLMI